jgi:hypothetical protein
MFVGQSIAQSVQPDLPSEILQGTLGMTGLWDQGIHRLSQLSSPEVLHEMGTRGERDSLMTVTIYESSQLALLNNCLIVCTSSTVSASLYPVPGQKARSRPFVPLFLVRHLFLSTADVIDRHRPYRLPD